MGAKRHVPTSRIFVSPAAINRNVKNKTNEPPVTVNVGNGDKFCHEAIIYHDGIEVARVVYRPNNPLPNGARVWVETTQPVACVDLNDGYPGNDHPDRRHTVPVVQRRTGYDEQGNKQHLPQLPETD